MDEKKITMAYQGFYQEIYRFFRKQRLTPQEAEDGVQETFTRYINAGAPPLRSPKAYLFSIARNFWYETLKKKLPEANCSAEPVPQPDRVLEMKQKQKALEKILADLPPRARQVFILHRTQNLTYQDIADQLGISVKTVENHLAGALFQIRKKL